jgi:hypothetical protein
MLMLRITINLKSQAPISLPAAGRQINSKHQCPKLLVIGIWLLFVIWNLEIGYYLFN